MSSIFKLHFLRHYFFNFKNISGRGTANILNFPKHPQFSNYKCALEDLNLDKLETRRRKLNLNFAKKSLKLSNMCTLFPLKTSAHNMKKRNYQKYEVNKANTYRYKVSSVPHMQCLLNEDVNEQNDLVNSLKQNCNLVNCDLCTHI